MNKIRDMRTEAIRRGGATVAYIGDIKEEESIFISYFRTYCDGYESRIKLEEVFLSTFGIEEGYSSLDALERFCELIFKKGRRRLVRHDISCECVGADENCLCQLIFSACEDNLEDAKLISMLITDAYLSEELTMLARKIGMTIRRHIERREKTKCINRPWVKEFVQVN